MAVAGSNITVSVVSHGQWPMVERLLADLNRLDSLVGVKVVLTVNVPERIGDVSRFERLRVELLFNRVPKGFGANHNAAFGRCDTRWFAVLNPDLRLSVDPFPRLVEVMQADTRYGVAAPTVSGPDGLAEDSVRGNLTPWSLLSRYFYPGRRVRDAVDPGKFFWIAGMFMLFDADVFRDVGGFDDRFFLYCEDYDICARIWLGGRDIAFVKDAAVVHEAQRDSHKSFSHFSWHVTSLTRVWRSAAFWKVTFRRRPPCFE